MNLARRLILRPISQFNSKALSSSSSHLFTLFISKKDPVAEVTAILDKSSRIEPALDRIASTLSPRIVSSVIQKQRDSKMGFRFFIWALEKRHLRAWVLRDLIIQMMNSGDGFELYWKTLEEIRSCGVGVPSDAFFVLISGYLQAGNAEKAVECFGKMRDFDCKPNVYTYNAILYVMVQKEVFLLALAVYNQMLKINCSPNVATYSILIDGLCKSGKIQDALHLFDQMAQQGIWPNNITYTIVLSGLYQAKRANDARLLFDKMTNSGCCPDSITYNAMLSGFCKLGMIDEAFKLLRLFESDGYDIGINGYSCLIDGLFRSGRFDEANKWFRRCCEANVAPDLVLYTVMIRGFSEAGKIKDALKMVREMTERGVVPDTQCYNALIKGFCDMGLLDDAQALKLEISESDCFPDTCTYSILICGMCRHGLVGEAKQIFDEMEKLGCFPSVVTFNSLIDGLCKAGELEEARLLFYKMEIGRNPSVFLRLSQGADRVLDRTSLQNLVERLCESGLYLKAYRLLMKLADNGVVPNISTYNILINGMCKAGNINGAFKLFRELQVKGHSPDSVTYGTLIDGLCRVDRDEDAFLLLDQMTRNGCSPSSAVYKSLMTWSSRKRKVSMGFSLWMKYLRSLQNRDNEAIELFEGHLERGELKEAIQGLVEMDMKLNEFDLAPYTIWLIGLCRVGRIEEALEIFHVLMEYKIDLTPPSCVKLIQALCREGKLDTAISVFLYTIDKGFMLMPNVCNQLLSSLLQSETERKHAFVLLSRMESSGYDLDACLQHRTQSLLHRHLNAQEPVLKVQDDKPRQMASPG